MSAAAISTAPQELVPHINFKIDEVTRQGFAIHKISLEILAKPWFQKENKWTYSCAIEQKMTNAFHKPFDKNSYLPQVIELLTECTTELKKLGSFAELTCTTTIDAGRDRGDGTTLLCIKKWTNHVSDYLDRPSWEGTLFGTTPAV